MKRKKENGFTMILVIFALFMISISLLILTGGSNVIMFQSNQTYLNACQDNLKASAAAWAETNTEQKTADKEIQLDTTEMNIPRSQLTVKISKLQNQKNRFDVTASCSKARNTMTRTYNLQIDAPN